MYQSGCLSIFVLTCVCARDVPSFAEGDSPKGAETNTPATTQTQERKRREMATAPSSLLVAINVVP